MRCPFCKHPLEPLILEGRHTGAHQCIHCLGSWLSQQHFSGLLGGEGGQSVHPSPLLAERGSGAGSVQVSLHHQTGPGTSPWGSTCGPWEHVPGAFEVPQTTAEERTRTHTWWHRWFKKQNDEVTSAPDWDLCTYCGKPDPGDRDNCRHCNVERMRCPQCQTLMIGVRRFTVLVDMCLSCRGLFFEKGRFNSLIARMRGEIEDTAVGGGKRSGSSLLHQLADFLEATEPSPYALNTQENKGVLYTVASAMGSGLGESRKVFYDFLILLGDIQGPRDKTQNKEPSQH